MKSKTNSNVLIWSVIVALGGFLFGFDTAVISGVEEHIQRLFQLTPFWHGFTIRPGADGYNSESNENCYEVSDMLEKLFVNPREIMMGKGVNNSFNLKYLSRSIEKDPEKLLMYEDDQEMYNSIIRLLNWDKKKLDAVLKVNRIKNQF